MKRCVDLQAQASLALDQTYYKIPFFSILNHLSINIAWISGELHGITFVTNFLKYCSKHKKRSVLARISLDHTRVTYSCLVIGEEQPQGVGCGALFTVRHFLFGM